MSPYDFDDKLREGQDGERILDEYFSQWFDITPATRAGQRAGYDRVYRLRSTGERWCVEYKTDKRASETGNAFVETVSVRKDGAKDVPGWAYKSHADRLLYYIPGDELVYLFSFDALRAELPRWASTYPTRDIPNKGYVTVGLHVPLDEFEQHATNVICL